MVHRIVWRVASAEAIDFWEERLGARTGSRPSREGDRLLFSDPEGLDHELAVVEAGDEPLIAEHPEIPGELALQGFHAVRAYSADPEASRGLLEALEFEPLGRRLGGARRAAAAASTSTTSRRRSAALQGAGSVHHVAWASTIEEHESWREAAIRGGAQPTPVIDRFYFKSIYFREPSGVLFEIATLGPGFTVDEPLEHLGEKLSLPPDFEHLRDEVEPKLRPIVNPRVPPRRS